MNSNSSLNTLSTTFLAKLALIAIFLQALISLAIAPLFSGIDDINYLSTVFDLLKGDSLSDIGHPLFRFRVGMSIPLLIGSEAGLITLENFWHLTVLLNTFTLIFLALAACMVFNQRTGVIVALLWALYPLATSQSVVYMPTTFQSFFISASILTMVYSGASESTSKKLFQSFFAGVLLGLGYLVKEDTALVVPCMFFAGIISRILPIHVWVIFASGAASVFFLECAFYYINYGEALIRLTSSANNATEVSGHISSIWNWDAYIRSLLLVPYQVGLYWWFLIFSIVAAIFSSPDSKLRFLLITTTLLFAWLQFGTGSFSSYSPLPKVPRYTVIASPFVILLVGWWIGSLWGKNKKLAKITIVLLVSSSLACIFFLSIQVNERTRNTIAVLSTIKDKGIKKVYTDYYSANLISILLEGKTQGISHYHGNFSQAQKTGETPQVILSNQDIAGEHIFIDYQQAKIYTQTYEIPLPPTIENPPEHWKAIWKGHAYPKGSAARYLLELILENTNLIPVDSLKKRIHRFVSGMIISDEATLYFVPKLAPGNRATSKLPRTL